MKHYISLFLSLTLIAVLGACSKEDPFPGGESTDMGRVLKSALAVELSNSEGLPAVMGRPADLTRAAIPTPDDFTVDFIADGATEPYASYLFAEMPEVVTLPVGVYKAVAHYGENATHAWEAPYYEGSTTFNVVKDVITQVADPIVASLANVRVSIKFDYTLSQNMSSDSKVTVKVGESGTLDFTAADADRSGYFAYVANSCSLTATFSGEVEGLRVVESKVFDNVAPGTHYAITFRLHDAGEEDPGEINAGVVVDASVTIVDMNVVVDPEEDEVLVDDLRPVQGGDDNKDPDTPDTPDTPNAAPVMTALEPEQGSGLNKLDLDKVNDIDNLYCAWKVVSTADGGFRTFKVEIISDKLTPEELEGVGLAADLDLVNPGQYAGPLQGLGFPINVGGQNEVEFDITGFLGMMAVLGEADHEFRLTISDANGTTVKSVKLHCN